MIGLNRHLRGPLEWLPQTVSSNLSSLDAAQGFVEGMYVPHALNVLTPGGEVNLTVRSAWTEHTGLIYMDYGERVQISPEPLEGFVLVQIPLAGSATLRVGSRVIDSSPALATLPSSKEPSVMQWGKNNPHLCVYVEQEKLNDVASILYGVSQVEKDVRLGSSIDLRSTEGMGFLAALEAFHDDLNTTVNATQMVRLSEEALLGRLLLSTRNSIGVSLGAWDTTFAVKSKNASPLASEYRDLVDQHYSEDVSIGDFAERLSVSIRTLQAATAKEFGLTPRMILLHKRLEASREMLLAPEHAHTPVSEVALACGFNHLGRFASSYRLYFTELPRETRQRLN